MSTLMMRRRMLHEDEKSNDIKYPLVDGTYPQYSNINYEVKDGVIHVSAGTSRFCLTTPTVPYNAGCVNNESWVIPSGSNVFFEIDNTAGLTWYCRTTDNKNLKLTEDFLNKEFQLWKEIKNIFALGTATEGEVNMKFFVNGERWI